MARILIAGESWMTLALHTKGFDTFTTSSYVEGVSDFRAALEAEGHTVDYQPCHVAAEHFPDSQAELDAYDVVVLSDIGSNTLLLPARSFIEAQITPNRLATLAGWVANGGALAMVGGYLSFSGIEAKANYRGTPLAAVLPVKMEVGDDREETPQGVAFRRTELEHPITADLETEWPPVLGFQRFTAKPSADVLAVAGDHPALVIGTHGKGRVLAFATDVGPHWAPSGFIGWPGFGRLWETPCGGSPMMTSVPPTNPGGTW